MAGPSWLNGNAGSSGGRGGAGPSWIKTAAPTGGKKPGKGKGHGFFHRLGADLYNTAVHAPSGLYDAGKAVVEPAYQDVRHGPSSKQAKKARANQTALAKGTVAAYKEDFQHPLRHPGNTLLDVAALASLGAGTAARAGAVGRAVSEGGTISDGLRAARAPKPRILEHEGRKVQAGNYSRGIIVRQTQKLFDQFHQAHPNVRPLPFGFRNFPERVGKEIAATERFQELLGRAPAAELVHIGKKLTTPQQVALRIVAEGVPIDERIRFHEAKLGELKGRTLKTTRRQIELLKLARRYVHDVNGMPRFRPDQGKLIDVYAKARSVAQEREAALGQTTRVVRHDGQVMRVPTLGPNAEGRIHAPGNVIRSGEPYPSTEVQASARFVQTNGLDPSLVPEVFHGGEFRIPYTADHPKSALFKSAGYRGGNERAPGTVTRSFTGALLKHGIFRNDTTRLVAESYLEAHRFKALVDMRDQLISHAKAVPETEHDIPIRLDALKDKPWPKIVQKFEDESNLKPAEVEAAGRAFDSLREELFPPKEAFVDGPHAHPDVMWIDERLLGGINRPNPMVGFDAVPALKKGMTVFDSINNASRLAILYLKPAYAVPNLLGNVALTLVQQGFAAPKNLAIAARLNAKLGPELGAKVDAVMGEGVTGALHAHEGPLQKVTNAGAQFWQGPIDKPFRRASFLFEAKRAGYKTPAQLHVLFKDRDKLGAVAREANNSLIDYGRLGPTERGLIRRVIFFYPWVKGSTQYAGRFLAEHPIQAAAAAELGKQGAAKDAFDLGPVPSFAEGLFKVGDRGGNPLVANPNSAGILQTPADIAKSITELASGHPGGAFELGQNLTPAAAALVALLTNYGHYRGQSPLSNAKDQLIGGIPALVTLEQLRHPPANAKKARMYPRTREDVLLHFLLGGLAPTPLNKGKAAQKKYLEDHPR